MEQVGSILHGVKNLSSKEATYTIFLIKMYTCFSKKQKTTHRLYDKLEIAMESATSQAVGKII